MKKSNIKALIKSNRSLYTLYYWGFSSVLRMIGVFVKTDPDTILFVSYGGKKYDDSPRKIFEYLKTQPEYKKLKLIWAFIDSEAYPEVKEKVRIDSLQYYLAALKAGYWITNSSASRGLNFRKRSTKNILFEHGMAGIKKLGKDINSKEGTFSLAFKEVFDYVFIEGKKEVPILTKAWDVSPDLFRCTGLPRNDDLFEVSTYEIRAIKRKLHLPPDKKILLYAPTFREQSRDKNKQNVLRFPFQINKWEKELGNDFILLITAHYEVSRYLNEIGDTGFVRNMFGYPVLNDLLKVSDILITDYSSIVFDFSVLERPILCYGYDYEEYNAERGFYIDINTLFSHGVIKKEEELIETIKHMKYKDECKYTKNNIKEKYVFCDGKATENAIKVIFGQ